MSARDAVADDDFKRRAMDAYKAKGKSATVSAAAKMKVGAARTRQAVAERSDSESSLSSESELSDEDAPSPQGRSKGRGRRQEDSMSGSDSDGGGRGKREGFTDDTFGTDGAKLAKKMRQRVRSATAWQRGRPRPLPASTLLAVPPLPPAGGPAESRQPPLCAPSCGEISRPALPLRSSLTVILAPHLDSQEYL